MERDRPLMDICESEHHRRVFVLRSLLEFILNSAEHHCEKVFGLGDFQTISMADSPTMIHSCWSAW